MICPYCKQEHPPEVKYCPLTGNPIIVDSRNCPVCRGIIFDETAVCPHCGHKLDKKGRGIYIYLLVAIFGLVFIVIGAWILLPFLIRQVPATEQDVPVSLPSVEQQTSPNPVLSNGSTPTAGIPGSAPSMTATPQFELTATPTTQPTFTWTPAPTETPLRLVTPVAVEINEIDLAEMVLVPEGEFLMGSDPEVDPYYWGAESPTHPVFLDDYWVYRTEVTNAMYAKCVGEQKCPLPQSISSKTRTEYYDNPQYADYPVVYVRWKDASAYCKWAGGRLPTEAEWEKAARGEDGRLFAWGNELPNPQLANYLSADTEPVGSYPAGASPYGAYDMSGNVREWVIDYYQATYYQVSPYENPRGPASGARQVFRGGHFNESIEALRVVARASLPVNDTQFGHGFRCVVEAP